MAKAELEPYVDVDIRVISDPSKEVIDAYMEQKGYELYKSYRTIEGAIFSAIGYARSNTNVAITLMTNIKHYKVWGIAR